MKKILLLVLYVFFTYTTFASHLLGGMIGVFQTSQDSTSVGVWLVSDGQTPIPMPASITVERWEMNSVGWYVQNGTLTLTKATSANFQGQILTNYVSNYLDLDSNKYRFIYKNCCWGIINNSSNSMNSEFIISADYWHIPYNSTPYAVNPLIFNVQAGIRNTMKPLWGNFNCFLSNPDSWGDLVNITQTDLHFGYGNGVFVPQIHTQLNLHVDNDSISFVPNSTLGRYGTGFEITDTRPGLGIIGVQRIQWTFNVVSSTVGLEEVDVVQSYQVWDWTGNYIGRDIEWKELKGFYILRYDDGRIEKTFIN